jgi:hypothetical protein
MPDREDIAADHLSVAVLVRQAKPGGSCQLKGTDHGNCSFAMKLAGGVMGNHAVEAR